MLMPCSIAADCIDIPWLLKSIPLSFVAPVPQNFVFVDYEFDFFGAALKQKLSQLCVVVRSEWYCIYRRIEIFSC